LAGVGLAASAPQLALALVGGAVSDRMPRRTVLVASDLVRGVAVGCVAVSGFLGGLRLWQLWAAAFVIGAATAFGSPAFDAIVPELVPDEHLPNANALDQFVRPTALRLVGPALGGATVAAAGSAGAFAVDASSFFFSAACVWRMAPARKGSSAHRGDVPVRAEQERASLGADLRSGLRYVRGETWLWGTFAAAAFTYLLFLGPTEVLIPFLVKNRLHGSAGSLGVVLGLGGAGSLVAAAAVAQGGGARLRQRSPILCMYAAWSGATLLVAGYGVATKQWQVAAIAFGFGALEAAGTVVWATLKQRLVPGGLLGRVSSIDWFVSSALLPLSYVLTPLAVRLLGVRSTFVWAGVVGSVVTAGFLFLPGMRKHDTGLHLRRRDSSTTRVGEPMRLNPEAT
jgi:MFS family permease